MKLKNSLMFLSSLMLFVIVGCSSDDDNDDDGASLIDTPTEYSFESRFNSGESSVSYSGQVVRNLLINDIKTQMGADAGSGNPATLVSMMANDNSDQAILSSAGDMSTVQTKYHDISTSHLNDRLTAVDSYIIPGYNANATALVNGWVQECVANGKTRLTGDNAGIRLDQITQKTLWGAVSYWQATSKYMSKIPTDDNSMASGDDNYKAELQSLTNDRTKPSGKINLQSKPTIKQISKPIVTASKQLSGKEVYNAACMSCHASGAAGAPMTGNNEQWSDRLAKGKEILYSSAVNGIGVMPAKGGIATLSDDEVKSAVDYLISELN